MDDPDPVAQTVPAILFRHVGAGDDHCPASPDRGQPFRCVAVLPPQGRRAQTSAPTRKIQGQARRSEPPRAWGRLGPPVHLRPADAGPPVRVREIDLGRDLPGPAFEPDVDETVVEDDVRRPLPHAGQPTFGPERLRAEPRDLRVFGEPRAVRRVRRLVEHRQPVPPGAQGRDHGPQIGLDPADDPGVRADHGDLHLGIRSDGLAGITAGTRRRHRCPGTRCPTRAAPRAGRLQSTSRHQGST